MSQVGAKPDDEAQSSGSVAAPADKSGAAEFSRLSH